MPKLTIPRNMPHTHLRGDYRCRCDLCGALYMRSDCRRDNELLRCKDCQKGREKTELSMLNAQAASGRRAVARATDSGSGGDTRNLEPVNRTTYEDIFDLGD